MNSITMIFSEKILKDNSISSTEKIIYGIIGALTNKKGYCYASNDYISKQLNLSKRTISKAINNLKNKSYIRIETKNYKRKIYTISIEELFHRV